jgi:hypothetical protein
MAPIDTTDEIPAQGERERTELLLDSLVSLHLSEQPEHRRSRRLVLLQVDQQLGAGWLMGPLDDYFIWRTSSSPASTRSP